MASGSSSNMYDPARDIFTASEEAQTAAPEEPGNKRKRTASPDDSAAQQALEVEASHTKHLSDESQQPPAKRTKESPAKTDGTPIPMTAASLSKVQVKRRDPGARSPAMRGREQASRRSRSPQQKPTERTRRRDHGSPIKRRSLSPKPIPRSPSPPARSPPRQRKRPGAAAKISSVDQEAVKRRQEEREKERQIEAKAQAEARGVHDVVKQHYNAVPQRGKEWRKTDSKIKGLRSLNNWVKSAIIQRYSPSENYAPGSRENGQYGGMHSQHGLLVLDIGCGKGGDLQKWHAAPQRVDLYVGIDPADVSIEQARERYAEMRRRGRGGGGGRDRNRPLFQAEFINKDCYGEWIGTVPIVQEVGIDGSVGPDGGGHSTRWGGGGFDVVSMMFCMHYAFESEDKARGMLRNVAGSLKKGGRFIGVIPNSDVLTAKVNEFNTQNANTANAYANLENGNGNDVDDDDDWDPEKPSEVNGNVDSNEDVSKTEANNTMSDEPKKRLEWGNSIYQVKFPGKVPSDGVFRPPYGWKYFYFLEEAVEEIPEYVVPWEAFRALAADYDLELQYKRSFDEIWEAEKDDPVLGPLSERMGVKERGGGGKSLVADDEFEAAKFYIGFCFYKT